MWYSNLVHVGNKKRQSSLIPPKVHHPSSLTLVLHGCCDFSDRRARDDPGWATVVKCLTLGCYQYRQAQADDNSAHDEEACMSLGFDAITYTNVTNSACSVRSLASPTRTKGIPVDDDMLLDSATSSLLDPTNKVLTLEHTFCDPISEVTEPIPQAQVSTSNGDSVGSLGLALETPARKYIPSLSDENGSKDDSGAGMVSLTHDNVCSYVTFSSTDVAPLALFGTQRKPKSIPMFATVTKPSRSKLYPLFSFFVCLVIINL